MSWGVADRTSFFEFQARNRRSSWRLGGVCALVVGGGGLLAAVGLAVNFFLVLFALVFVPAVLLLGLGFLAAVTPAAAQLREPLWDTALFLMKGLDLLTWLASEAGPGGLAACAAVLAAGSWLAVRRVWLDAGVGETLLAMGARAPAAGDLEEQQLVNVVIEMAIAAGLEPPGVRLLDGTVANAAAVGFDGGERYVVVGRRLLDEFDRDETQAVVAHLVGVMGNGDLRGAAQIHAMLYVLDLLLVVVLAPFARLPRRVARRWLLFPLWSLGHSREQRAVEARALVHLLEAHRATLPADGGEQGGPQAAEYFGPVGRVLVRVVPPLLALILFGVVAIASVLLAASVPVALLWRSRRYLADATAVQLTRNPTALYRALIRLVECGAAVTGGERVAHLFVVGPEVAAAREWLDRVHAGARLRAGLPPRIRREVPLPPADRVEAKRGFLGEYEGLMGMHPALRRRLARLVRMGAVPPEAPAG